MKNLEKRNKLLNKEQREAVETTEGPLMVIAGPGSGKTELLTLRVAEILKKTDTPPESILCLTFTDSASTTMKERLINLIGEDAYKVPINTFHGFCQKIIEEYPQYFYKGAGYNVASRSIRVSILEEIIEDLDYDDPLSKSYPERGYLYLKPIEEAISDLKKGGLSPDEFKEAIEENKKIIEEINPLIDKIFRERVSKETIFKVEEAIPFLENIKDKSFLSHLIPLNKIIAASLKEALEEGSKGMSKWKKDWTVKEGEGRILKDFRDLEKMESLASVYKKYEERMKREGYYDFSDMLLEVIKKMEEDENFYFSIREKYLYLLVDEFQDTNGVQMRLLNLLAKDDVDQNPNICTVGDDDQAIYKFQGAEISNILDFKRNYPQSKIVVLKKNYRSTDDILKTALEIIRRGEERLENRLPEVDKSLVSKREEKSEIVAKEFNSKEEELSFVAEKVKEKMKEINPEEIAVIARKHKHLTEALPFFREMGIPTFSERKENVLKRSEIVEIITVIKFAYYLLKGEKETADSLLSQIVTFPFWEIKREKIWKLSLETYKERVSWMEKVKKDPDFKKMVNFLEEFSIKAKHSSLEEVFDLVIGTKKGEYESPFKKYYFSKERMEKEKGECLSLLSALKRLLRAVKEYKPGKMTKIEDLVELLELHEKNDIPILDKNPLVTEKEAVFLTTAHGAKGKEFKAVFVLGCNQDNWASSRGGNMIRLSSNMPFQAIGEKKDDQLRLFYVTLTRAKNYLFFTSHKTKEDGRKTTPLEFINFLDIKEESFEVNLEALSTFNTLLPLVKEEKNFLLPLVEKYKLSATSFTKFLDVASKGPESFLEENLLRFPEKKSFFLSFGTAIHETLAEIFFTFQKEGKRLKEKEVLEIFKSFLIRENMGEKDFKKALKKGEKALISFLKEKKDQFSLENSLMEKNFRDQECRVGDIEITGKVDRMVFLDSEIVVSDFKTGRALEEWKQSGNYEKIKSWKYRNQLIFYKILIESSREYGKNYRVNKGILEFVEPNKEGEIIDLELEMERDEVERVKALIMAIGKRIKDLNFSQPKGENLEDIKEFENELLKEI